MLAFSAIDSPVVVAMIMNAALSIEQQSILAGLQRQGSVRAEEEVIAVLWMGISLLAILFGTLAGSSMSCKHKACNKLQSQVNCYTRAIMQTRK